MPTRPTQPNDPLDPTQYTGLVKAALDPDERKFFKEYLGQESPNISDYLLPQGRFANARQVREDIVRSTLSQMIPSATNPMATLGEARGIVKDFPTPPNALKYAEAEGPGAPVPRFTPQEMAQYNMPADWAEHRDEGPRPTSPAPYEDLSTVLPRSYQNLLVAKTHQAGLRPFAPSVTMSSDLFDRLQELRQGAEPKYPEEMNDVLSKLNMVTKAPMAGSDQARSLNAKASLDEQKAKRYQGLTDAQIAQMTARTAADNAKAHDLYQGFDKRMAVLDSQIAKNTAQGKAAGDLMGLNKEKLEIQQAKGLLAYQRWLSAKEDLDQESMDYWGNEIIRMFGGQFDLKRGEPNFLQSLLNIPGKLGVTPHGPVGPIQPPTGNPLQPNPNLAPEQNGLQAPVEAITSPPPEDKKAQAKALYDRMKEGEVQTFDGRKYKKSGMKLVPVE